MPTFLWAALVLFFIVVACGVVATEYQDQMMLTSVLVTGLKGSFLTVPILYFTIYAVIEITLMRKRWIERYGAD